ncbi:MULTISPECIES: hypothetical protein [Campylobacter]|uniref:Putative membrane protein n=1 Tax=Campylobacter porcelli TaxID=1660073 RepID=A0A1X9SXV9_9BACT|nr:MULTISPECIES: hypothetical protein [unclassified Campylobacter]MCR8679375.1 hypothetical protein [Campylobacter sp. RM19072]MCR8696519.1 hypothetical protein [Campylobacter sp. RM19073]MEE3705193.1 hypothetical protein [Campylobacter sp. CX2-8023-23]MEE3744921.1 hypothetical protein [Campylobacter sp. CX2-4855-23]MEE3777219.1 hypothetical protein [Campylobacter sp. CX2-4080-23]
MKFILLIFLCVIFGFAHGVSYTVNDGKAIIISANFTQNTPVAYGKIDIYEGDSAIALLHGQTDSYGKFAFLPPKSGIYRIELTAFSDHGEHKSEFSVTVNDDFSVEKYDELAYVKYQGVLSVIGVLFGIFGILVLVKHRKFKKLDKVNIS